MYDSEQARKNREYYLSRGRCPRCGGKNPVEDGKARCRECGVKESERLRARKARWIAAGLCSRCGGPLDGDGKKTCIECREYAAQFQPQKAEAAKAVYDALKESGHCVRCKTRWAEAGRAYCGICLNEHKQWQKNYDPDGDKKRQQRRERVEAGLCIDCNAPTEDGKQRCQRCVEKRRDSTRKYKIRQRIKREADRAREGVYG